MKYKEQYGICGNLFLFFLLFYLFANVSDGLYFEHHFCLSQEMIQFTIVTAFVYLNVFIQYSLYPLRDLDI